MKKSETTTKTWDYAVSAMVAGVITKSSCAPLERIRLLYQVQGMFSTHEGSVESVKYRSLSHTFKTILREEGIKGFWRGNGTNIVRAGVVYAAKLGTNDILKERMLRRKKHKLEAGGEKRGAQITGLPPGHRQPVQLGVISLMQAGFIAGLIQKCLTYPLDLLSVRIALGVNTSNLGEKTYDSIWSAVKRIKSTEGMMGFYKGFAPTLLTGAPYVSLQMTLFEVYRRKIVAMFGYKEENALRSPTQVFISSSLSGSLAGLTAQCIVFPGDTVRKRMMSNGVDGKPRLYKNSIDCASKIYKREGVKAFYNGVRPLVIRALPNGALQFGSYELLKFVFRYFKETPMNEV